MITRSQKAKFIINKAIFEIEWLSRFLKNYSSSESSGRAYKFRKLIYFGECNRPLHPVAELIKYHITDPDEVVRTSGRALLP